MPWQLQVIDGADVKRIFPLPDEGTVTLGSSGKHADICLHDLYVARVHAEIELTAGGVVVRDSKQSAAGTFLNKAKLHNAEPLNLGDVVRVGNSYLRLEPAVAAAPAKSKDDPAELPTLPGDRLDELTGHTLGHYELEESLGRSALKCVFRAKDLKTGQIVSLKVFGPEFPAQPAELQHFIPAMRKALHVKHDHLVQLFGAGKTGPYTWVAREYVEGECLATVLERVAQGGGKPKWRHALKLALEVGAALDHVHQEHLIHGNVTPHNILLKSPGKVAKLANLMLDAAFDGSELAKRAAPAKRAQDAAYLAPEQVTDGGFVDALTDLYSLGAVVYARLTGRPPFQGRDADDTCELIRAGLPTRPRKLNPSIPDDLEAVVLKMLAKHPEERYGTAGQMLRDLEPFAEAAELTGAE